MFDTLSGKLQNAFRNLRGLGKISDPNGDGTIRCQPWKNPKTGHWFMPRGFQLISAGPDTQFNTDDDITNFER